ncbi:hypothetical protein R3P38DRAFT_3193717 [Favolaschia claudopus]|uniref:Uncharacterized protein n=1 Tax=Favolaschia claudopus TaxID=2862362 RepID=A0AAW0BFC7_9AGAR
MSSTTDDAASRPRKVTPSCIFFCPSQPTAVNPLRRPLLSFPPSSAVASSSSPMPSIPTRFSRPPRTILVKDADRPFHIYTTHHPPGVLNFILTRRSVGTRNPQSPREQADYSFVRSNVRMRRGLNDNGTAPSIHPPATIACPTSVALHAASHPISHLATAGLFRVPTLREERRGEERRDVMETSVSTRGIGKGVVSLRLLSLLCLPPDKATMHHARSLPPPWCDWLDRYDCRLSTVDWARCDERGTGREEGNGKDMHERLGWNPTSRRARLTRMETCPPLCAGYIRTRHIPTLRTSLAATPPPP